MGTDVLVVLVIVLVIVVIWQGPKNLPKLGQALGRSISDFRKEVSTDEKPAEPPPSVGSTTAPVVTSSTAPPQTPPTTPSDPPSG